MADVPDVEVEALVRQMKRASVLKMQCKKHQVFREHMEEAMKIAEAGQLHLQIANALRLKSDVEGRVFHLKEAASCLARAKRLSKVLSKE